MAGPPREATDTISFNPPTPGHSLTSTAYSAPRGLQAQQNCVAEPLTAGRLSWWPQGQVGPAPRGQKAMVGKDHLLMPASFQEEAAF